MANGGELIELFNRVKVVGAHHEYGRVGTIVARAERGRWLVKFDNPLFAQAEIHFTDLRKVNKGRG